MLKPIQIVLVILIVFGCSYECPDGQQAGACQECPPPLTEGYILNWSGAKQLGSVANETGHSIATDFLGSVYITGNTYGSLFSTNTGPTNTPWTSDFFVAKYFGTGNQHWTVQKGTSSDEYGMGIAVDNTRNVFIAGSTSKSLEDSSDLGSFNIFISKFDIRGAKIWSRYWGTTLNDTSRSINIDGSGNVYVTGSTYGVFDGQTGFGGNDLFLVKYDSDGNTQWHRQLGSSENDEGMGVVTDANNNIYITGYTLGNFDGNNNKNQFGEVWHRYDAIIIKYDTNGNKVWSKQLGTSHADIPQDITIDSSGYLYITGDTNGDLDGNTNSGSKNDLFVSKYDPNGILQWTEQLGTSEGTSGLGITLDSSNNIYVTGRTKGNLDGNLSSGNDDGFVVKYDSNGSKIWTRQFGTSEIDFPQDIAADTKGNIFVTGYTQGSIDGATSLGGNDVFIIKYDSEGNRK
tara:strand:- start:93 stop:1469 length:1377 start_codon:yes stop_codon:yes gene_type:complete